MNVSNKQEIILRLHGILDKRILRKYDTNSILKDLAKKTNVLILLTDYADQSVSVGQSFNYLGYETKLFACKSTLIKPTEWAKGLPEISIGNKSVSAFEIEDTALFIKYLPVGIAALIIPPFIRNAVYDYIARNRYKWYGRSDTCLMPKPEWKNRFIEI